MSLEHEYNSQVVSVLRAYDGMYLQASLFSVEMDPSESTISVNHQENEPTLLDIGQQQRIHELEAIIEEKDRTIQSLLFQRFNLHQEYLSTQEVVKPQALPHDEPQSNIFSSHTSSVLSSHQIQIERYSRQLMIPNGFGMEGQHKLQSSSILIVGAGGIGSTVILYLAACGVGHLTIVDHDTVELSNLHRQIIHTQESIGMYKAQSAVQAVHRLNPTISTKAIVQQVTRQNALTLVEHHSLVVDASDNAQTRYCVSDACVRAGNIPLVSGSAMGLEGQVSVYVSVGSDDPDLIPCYRCMYPNMPKSEACKSCNDHGVLGPIPGFIGILVSVEVIKVITGHGKTMSNRLLMYDSMQPSFLIFKKPMKRRHDCIVCNESFRSSCENDETEIEKSCILDTARNNYPEVTCEEYRSIVSCKIPHVLLDVRNHRQYEMCSLPGSINIPLSELENEMDQIRHLSNHGQIPIYCICRRGIASLDATKLLLDAPYVEDHSETSTLRLQVYNIQGGLQRWASTIDPTFPRY